MKKTAEWVKSQKGKKRLSMLTAYDSLFAEMEDQQGIDMILVGDSVGMVALGYSSTIPVTVSDILHHTKAVSRVVKEALIIADMPFMSFGISREETIKNAALLIQEGGADAVKMEGAHPTTLDCINFLVARGIPVMGHIGLTPQAIKQLGSYKTQGKSREDALRLIENAKRLEQAGCFALVLEKIPEPLAKIITEQVSIPTIGIGAGRYCDGQVLVVYDMLGLFDKFVPKFVKQYVQLRPLILEAFKSYVSEVEQGTFPSEKYVFDMDPQILKEVQDEINKKSSRTDESA